MKRRCKFRVREDSYKASKAELQSRSPRAGVCSFTRLPCWPPQHAAVLIQSFVHHADSVRRQVAQPPQHGRHIHQPVSAVHDEQRAGGWQIFRPEIDGAPERYAELEWRVAGLAHKNAKIILLVLCVLCLSDMLGCIPSRCRDSCTGPFFNL